MCLNRDDLQSEEFSQSPLFLLKCKACLCRSGGVRRSDRSHRVQQQRPEDQLHPEDPGEAPGRSERGQAPTGVKGESVIHRVSPQSLNSVTQ